MMGGGDFKEQKLKQRWYEGRKGIMKHEGLRGVGMVAQGRGQGTGKDS